MCQPCRVIAEKWVTWNFVYKSFFYDLIAMTSTKMKLSQSQNHRDIQSTSHIDNAQPSSMDLALEFLRDNPSEKMTAAARIYKVNVNSLRSIISRAQKSKTTHGGHNRILSEIQIKAIYKYVEDSYYSGYGASRSMVFKAISHLRATEIPAKEPPSWRWFETFIKANPEIFRVVKTKAIA
jgi:hypothetical protein